MLKFLVSLESERRKSMKTIIEYHSCYDELLSMLFNNRKAKNNDKQVKLVNSNGK